MPCSKCARQALLERKYGGRSPADPRLTHYSGGPGAGRLFQNAIDMERKPNVWSCAHIFCGFAAIALLPLAKFGPVARAARSSITILQARARRIAPGWPELADWPLRLYRAGLLSAAGLRGLAIRLQPASPLASAPDATLDTRARRSCA